MADILSQDFALSDEEVTKLIRRHCSPLVPQSFRIIPLPGTIISCIRAAAAIAQHEALANSTHAKRESSWRRYECFPKFIGVDAILFSDSSDDESNSKPLPASPPCLEKDDWTPEELQRIALEPRQELFVPPSTVWLRPIGLTNLRAPSTTDTDNSNQIWPSS